MKNFIARYYNFFRDVLIWKRAEYYIISYPKVGRTWMRFFLASYLSEYYDVNVDMAFKALSSPHKSIPHIMFSHYGYDGQVINRIKSGVVERDPSVIKANTKELKGKKILYVARDPRDLIVSYYHYLCNKIKHPEVGKMTMSEFIRHNEYGISWAIEFMNIWYENQSNFKQFDVLSYEECRTNPNKGFTRMLTFLNIPIDKKILDNAIQKSSFESMKKMEVNNKFNSNLLPTLENPSDSNAMHVRKGKVGGYRDELSVDDINYLDAELKKLNKGFAYN